MTNPDLTYAPAFSSMDEALANVAREVLASGELVAPRGMVTREILGYSFRLINPRARMVGSPARRWSPALAVGEFCWHLGASDDVEYVAYYAKRWRDFSDDGRHVIGSCYGKRIFGPNDTGLSQWSVACDLLRVDADTRRAAIVIAEPRRDAAFSVDVACMTSIQFLIRDDALHCITTMRSEDFFWGLPYDVFLGTMLHELMAVQVGARLGWYQHTGASLHIYEPFFGKAEAIALEGGRLAPEPMLAMTHPEAIPDFLEVERSLRLDWRRAETSLNGLPEYWRRLSEPLVEWAQRKKPEPSC